MADINLTHSGAELDEAIEKALTDFPDVDGVTTIAAHVLAGDIFVDSTGNVVGTMPNRGAVTGEASAETPYAIEEGYHNGSGVVTSAGGGAVANSIVITEVDVNKRITKVDASSFTEIYPYMFNVSDSNAPFKYMNSIMLNLVEHIGNYAFYGCSELILSTFPNSLLSIGSNSFRGCGKITINSFPQGFVSITGQLSFFSCSALRNIWIPATCVTIEAASYGTAPFYGCSSLITFYCEAASKPAGWGAFWNYYSSSGQGTVNWGVTKEVFDAL